MSNLITIESGETGADQVILGLGAASYNGGTEVLSSMVEILVPLGFFAFLTIVIVMPIIIGLKKHKEVQQTIRHAIENGTELPPEFMSAMAPKEFKTPEQDLRKGMVLMAVGIGIALMALGISYEAEEAIGPLFGIASIPAMIGLAHFLLWAINRKKSDQDLVD